MKVAAQIEPCPQESSPEIPKLLPPEVQEELDRILTSESFRGSKRCQSFLRYVVEMTCSDQGEELKERTLGVVVFGRSPDYDTGTDAIVRVKANEVRRRLAQYSLTADPSRPVRITLNPGSYVPQVSRRPRPLPTVEPGMQIVPRIQGPRWRMMLVVVACLLTAATAGVVLHLRTVERASLRRFWSPFLGPVKPIICVSTPNAYQLASTAANAIGDSKAAMRVQDAFQSLHQASRVGMVADISEADLREAPVVLIGGPRFNHWSMTMANGYRFFFALENNVPVILDRSNPKRHWEMKRSSQSGRIGKDYVIITRVLHSLYGQPMVSIAGLSVYGSRTGGLLLSDPVLLRRMMKDAPGDWERKNLQMVVSVPVDSGVPQAPKLVASTYW